jgi:hypothetical protein
MGKVLHASGSGYFPYCIQESTDSKYAIWPLEKAMQTYWRVRTWTFSASGTVRIYDYPEAGDITDLPIDTSLSGIQSGSIFDDPYTSEDQLVCGGGFYKNDPETSDKFATIEFGGATKVDNLYDSGMEGVIYDIYSAEWRFGTFYNSWSVSVLGNDLPMDVVLFPNEEYEQELISASATLTPTLWWSYGGTYNTSTGARL